MKGISSALVLALLGACAAAPPPAPPAPSGQPLNGDAVRSAIAPQTDEDKENAKFARMQGYRLQKRDDKVLWCRRIAEIGSHLEHNDCVSDGTLALMRKTYEQNRGELQQALGACTGQATCGAK